MLNCVRSGYFHGRHPCCAAFEPAAGHVHQLQECLRSSRTAESNVQLDRTCVVPDPLRSSLEHPWVQPILLLLVLDRGVPKPSGGLHVPHIWRCVPSLLYDGRTGRRCDGARRSHRLHSFQHALFIRNCIVSICVYRLGWVTRLTFRSFLKQWCTPTIQTTWVVEVDVSCISLQLPY